MRDTQTRSEAELAVIYLKELIAANDEKYKERFTALRESALAQIASQDKALIKLEAETKTRFEEVNNFRRTLSDQALLFMPRLESDAKTGAIDDKLAVLSRSLDDKFDTLNRLVEKMQNERQSLASERAGVKDGWGFAVGGLGFVMLCIGLFMAIKGLKK